MFVLATLLSFVLTALAPQADQVQVIMVGQIRKVDARSRILTIRERVFPEGGARRAPTRPPDLGPGFPPNRPRGGSRRREIDTKVLYTPETVVMFDHQKVAAAELKVGDTVRITGRPKGKSLVATEIERVKEKDKGKDKDRDKTKPDPLLDKAALFNTLDSPRLECRSLL